MRNFYILLIYFLILTFSPIMITGCSTGADGKDGTGIIWRGQSASAPKNPEYMWAYYNTTTRCSYVWNGSAWVLLAGSEQTSFPVTILRSPDFSLKDVNFMKLYNNQVLTDGAPVKFGFKSDLPEVPYVLCTEENFFTLTGTKYKISEITADTKEVTVTNPENNTAVFDLTTHTCSFKNYDAFFQKTVQSENENKILYLNPVGAVKKSDGSGYRLTDYMRITDNVNTPGQAIEIDWSSQDIGIALAEISENTFVLVIPLQTFNDFFDYRYIYNGENIYYTSTLQNNNTNYDSDYYGERTKSSRSQAFADYCYNELCLNFDINYGLKALHGIGDFPDFDTYFASVGIKDSLKSTNPLTFATVLKDVCEFYFGDGHSNYLKNSYMLGKNTPVPLTHTSAHRKAYEAATKKYISARNEVYKNNDWSDTKGTRRKAAGYEVTPDGKTAIVRFDEFCYQALDSSDLKLKREQLLAENHKAMNTYAGYDEDVYDTPAFISAVNELIQSDSNIKNIVLDLSRNGGGSVHAAAFVISWMLGECTFNMTNPNTDAKYFMTYQADVNFDGVFDSMAGSNNNKKDTVKERTLFCLISPLSFSCGNTVPALLKASNSVTIIGSTSAGGAAFVHFTNAADGAIFRCSSKYVTGTAKNGSNYSIDSGVEPDFYINDPANFYEKSKIQTLVNNINNMTIN